VFKSTDGGASWSTANISNGVLVLVIDPVTPTTLYAGAGGGVYKSIDGGGIWSAAATGLPTTNVSALAIDLATPTTLYAGQRVMRGSEMACTKAPMAARTGVRATLV